MSNGSTWYSTSWEQAELDVQRSKILYGCGGGDKGTASGVVQNTQATVVKQVAMVSSNISDRLTGGQSAPPSYSSPDSDNQKRSAFEYQQTGLAAGDGVDGWNVWGNISRNKSDYLASSKERSSDVTNLVLGGDYQVSPDMIAGVSVAWNNSDGTITTGKVRADSDGYVVSPYLGVQLDDHFMLDVIGGFGHSNLEQGSTITGSSNSRFLAANLSYVEWRDTTQISARAGYLYSIDDAENSVVAGIEQADSGFKSRLDQLRIGIEIGEWMTMVGGTPYMPYAGVGFVRDTKLKTATTDSQWDRSGYELKVGVNLFDIDENTNGGFVWTKEVGRDNADNDTVMVNLNIAL